MNELKHLAIIMDGNRRWARQKALRLDFGYKEGAKKVKELIYWSIEEGIESLTLFAFSTENWQRPLSELNILFKLLDEYLDDNLKSFKKEGIRLKCIGDLSKLKENLQQKICFFEEETKNNKKLKLNLALSYGSKNELIRAIHALLKKGLEINEQNIKNHLDLSLDVDLLLRVGGEKRLSNFLLWQASYAELAFSDTLFPSFSKDEFDKIIAKYKNTKRNLGL